MGREALLFTMSFLILLPAPCGEQPQPAEREKALLEKGLRADLGLGEALVWCLHHSGVAVKTRSTLLVFDSPWLETQGNPPGPYVLSRGFIDPKEIAGQRVAVLVSHQHGDHLDWGIFDWAKYVKEIVYVVTEKIGATPRLQRFEKEKLPAGCVVRIDPDQRKTLFEGSAAPIVLRTSASTDDGVAFWVEVDGLTLLHTGDLALWAWEDADYDSMRSKYMKEIAKFQALGKPLDLAFLCADIRMKSKAVLSGAPLAVEALRPAMVLPIDNGAKHEEACAKLHEALAALPAGAAPGARVAPVRRPGDMFYYSSKRE